MSRLPTLWDGFRMHISPDAYIFKPTSSLGSAEVLTIDRKDGDIKLSNTVNAKPDGRVMNVDGILGLITLHTSDFLIVITSKEKVARVLSADIFMATDFRVFPINHDATPSLLDHPVEKTLLGLIKSHLYSAPFYFSYEYDLTSTLQRQASIADPSQPLWKRVDERFFWNRFLMNRFVQITSVDPNTDLSRYILPCMFGFLEVKSTTINNRDFILGLIARRSRHRAGTRYFSRGIDLDGNVSNFNETEQFVIADPKKEGNHTFGKIEGKARMSYVQTRGSVPVFWAEVNNLRYKPDLQIMEKVETAEATRRHFQDQVARYGDNYIANLVNQKGYEKPVKEAYERAIERLDNPQVHYTYYDFHHECKGIKFERVMELIDRLHEKGLESDDYFYHDMSRQGETPVRKQKSVVRTNCMDCLDRTNVVQGTLARWVLNDQLQTLGILSTDEKVEDKPEFMHMYRNMWADHADVISKAYSGTGALKTDFTRTGKRTQEGALQDGINSITRYVKNNFLDGSRQDAYDLFTGAWEPSMGLPQPDNRTLIARSMPWVLFFSLAMMFFSVLLPRQSYDALQSSAQPKNYFLLLWLGVALASLQYIVVRGLDYVDWPTLHRPVETMFYDGPGYSSGKKGRHGIESPLVSNHFNAATGATRSSTNGDPAAFATQNSARRSVTFSQDEKTD